MYCRVVQAAQPRLANLGKGKGSVSGGRRKAGDVAQQIVLFSHNAGVVPAQTVIECEPGARSEAVLNIKPIVVFEGVSCGVAGVLQPAVDSPGKEIANRGAGSVAIEFEPSPEPMSVDSLIDAGAMEIETELHVVLIDLPGKVVDELIIAVDAVTRIAGTGAELGNTAHENNGQAGVGYA